MKENTVAMQSMLCNYTHLHWINGSNLQIVENQTHNLAIEVERILEENEGIGEVVS